MDRKIRHRPKTFMWSPRFKNAVFKSEYILQPRHCSAHISRSRSPNDLNIFFPRKLRQFPRTFMSKGGSNSDVSNDVFFRQEDKDFHQVKM